MVERVSGVKASVGFASETGPRERNEDFPAPFLALNCHNRAGTLSRRSPMELGAQRAAAWPLRPQCVVFWMDFLICPKPWRCDARRPGS